MHQLTSVNPLEISNNLGGEKHPRRIQATDPF